MPSRGVVWLCQDLQLDGKLGPVSGYWASSPGNDGRILDDAEDLGFDVEAALSWGRDRAPIVLIRLHRGDYYSAGNQPPSWGLTCPAWPGESAARRASGAIVPRP